MPHKFSPNSTTRARPDFVGDQWGPIYKMSYDKLRKNLGKSVT